MRPYRARILKYVSLVVLVAVASYKLDHACLWFDEAVEYWYSKVLTGPLPFESSANMYERIVSTFQPPLYNALMYLWLMVGDSVWWFRLFGVVMALICGLGLYAAVRRVANEYVAAAAVLFLAFTWRMVYYWQESAEYCLMVAVLMWAVWGFVALTQEPTTKHAVLFTLFSVGAAYSQYGALLALFPLVLAAPIYLLRTGHKDVFVRLAASYLVALVVAVLPLIFFFFLPQISNARQAMGAVPLMDFSPKSFVATLSAVFHYLFIEDVPQLGKYILLGLLVVCTIVAYRLDKEGPYRLFFIVNVITYVLFYCAVETGYYTIVYATNPFMERYDLFLLPLWITLFFWAGSLVFAACASGELVVGTFEMRRLVRPAEVLLLCGLVVYCGTSWTLRLRDNWTKPEDMAGAVDLWYAEEAYGAATFVHMGADASFAYYVRENPAWDASLEDSVHYMAYYASETPNVYASDIRNAYPQGLPDKLYVITSHLDPYLGCFMEAFSQVGYREPQRVFTGGDTRMYCLTLA